MNKRTAIRNRIAYILARIDSALGGKALKSINEVSREYRNGLERLVVDAANGTIKVAAFRTAHNTLIDELSKPAYVEGLREGGVDEAEFDNDDEKTVLEWQFEQAGYVLDFAKAAVAVGKLKGDERTAARNAMLARVEKWVQSLNNLGAVGYARAKEGEMGFWQLGETEDHCHTCLSSSKLKPHRMVFWLGRTLPRSPELDCKGYNCDCSIISSKTGKVLYPRE